MSDIPVIDRARLGHLTAIGNGGQGRVWATGSIRINGDWPGAYKEYTGSVLARLDTRVLRQQIGFVPALPRTTGQWLCGQSAWPAALVQKHGGVRGFLMRRIPEDFELRLPQRDGSRLERNQTPPTLPRPASPAPPTNAASGAETTSTNTASEVAVTIGSVIVLLLVMLCLISSVLGIANAISAAP